MVEINRRQIVRSCKARGWTIQPQALESIEEYFLNHIGNNEDANKSLQRTFDSLIDEMKNKNTRTITFEILQILLENDVDNDAKQQIKSMTTVDKRNNKSRIDINKMKTNNAFDDFQVISAFETPRLIYESMRKQFRIEEKKWPLLGTAEDKINMLAQRFALIHQRILRHSLFRPTNLSHNGGRISATSRANIQHKLTPIECLLGGGAGGNRSNNSVLILGILIQIEEGQYYLEDQTGQVPVVFQDSVVIDGFFVTEQCILLVEGRFHDDMFLIDRLGHPLQETREISLQNIQQQVSHPLYASRKISNEINSSSFVVLSDVYLDQPRVLQQLESLFATYENFAIPRIPCFVIMGNFCSPTSHQPQQQNQQYSQNSVGQGRTVSAIEELVTLITKFPRLAQYAHFCIVPGPNDYGVLGCSHLHVLPLPPLDKVMKSSISSISGSKNVAHLNYGSNPCRIRFSGQEIVVFRYDLLHLMQQNQVLLQRNATSTDVDMTIDNDSNHHRQPHCRLVKTILDQGHLIPVSNVPLYWNYDSSLQLYPLPDALILGGDGPSSPYHEIYGGCQVIHPGSFVPTSSANTTSTGSSYAVFSPDGNSDADDELLDSATEKSTVEFLQVGNID